MMHYFREQLKKLSFDFMSCFFYDKEAGIFRPHKDEYKPCIEEDNSGAPI